MLKHPKSRQLKFQVGDAYLADKIKLSINKNGEVILISTSGIGGDAHDRVDGAELETLTTTADRGC